MLLSKIDALLLLKLINMVKVHTELSEQVEDLENRLDNFVINGDDKGEESDEDDEECDDEDCEACEGDDDDEEIEEDEEDAEEDATKEDDEESGEEDDEETDSKDEEDEVPTGTGYATDLHRLKAAKATIISSSAGDIDDDVSVEFEQVGNKCDLLVNGDYVAGPLSFIKRKSDELHIAEADDDDNLTWHRFSVSRFPKGWVDVLPVNELVEVV